MKDYTILQLFAEYNPQAQPPNALYDTSGNLNQRLRPEDQAYYDKQLIRKASPKLVYHQLGQKRDIPRRAGQRVNFRAFASLGKAMTPLVEGVTPAGQSITVTDIEAKPKQYGDFVSLTDYIDMTAIDPMVTETVQLIGDQAGLTNDSVVRDELFADASLNYQFAPKINGQTETPVYNSFAIDASCMLTVKEVEKAVAELRAQNAPTYEGNYYMAVVHPYVLFDLMQDPRWQEAQKYTNNVKKMYDGEVGAIGGARFISTTEAKIFKGENLLDSTTRNLTVASNASAASTSVSVSETLTADALIGRYVLIDGVRYKVTGNTTNALTISPALAGTVSANTTIYPGEGGAGGIGIFACLFVGQNAYGVTEVEGGGTRTIIKPLGSGGTSDPLDQRSTIGWKSLLTAKVLVPEYMRALFVGGSFATVNLKKN